MKIVIAGQDGYINSVLRPYVDQFSAKPPDWQGYVRFLVIPFGEYGIINVVKCLKFLVK